jgi:hypothetical protein
VGHNDAYFRIFISFTGITTVNTHLALRVEADPDSEVLALSTKQFCGMLAGAMLGPRPRRN